MLYPDSAAVPPIPDLNAPFMSVAELAPLLGLSTPVAAPLASQIQFAASGVSRMIRNYVGRVLSGGTYIEQFGQPSWAVRRRENGRLGIHLNLTEWPVTDLVSITRDGNPYSPTQGWSLNHSLGRLFLPWEGQPGVWSSPIQVEYTGGYTPLPADLLPIFLDVVRRQLTAMGADMGASTIPGATAAVKGVTVGALRVEYAVANAPASAFAAGAVSPFTGSVLADFAGVLDQYKSSRMFTATVS